ncbi:diguanylate cyclase [Saccharophagus degradans]|uniref:diguanylate cyclase n=1 Tax=Saccharophagus degradans TaxID=86304 RepID=UPI001C089218|nr:diguanylate cyclase [Saccharophagus degradans]MBU2987320.1 diguanylate cyclase [Saccharophagus degradans]
MTNLQAATTILNAILHRCTHPCLITWPAIIVLALTCNIAIAADTQSPSPAQTTSPPVHYNLTHYCGESDNMGNQYIDKLIKLAFSYHPATVSIETLGNRCSHAREKKLLEEGRSDIFWAATTKEFEATLIAIRIPIFRGLLGHRIAIIPRAHQGKYANVTTMEQVKKLTIGQGLDWTDARILKANGFDVTESADVENLYRMLLANRFDLFLRGVMEPWDEVNQHPELPLAVEENLMFIYRMPAYLFVSPKKPDIAAIIENGLWQALEDGSFDKVLINDPVFNEALQKLNAKKRTIFYLDNPLLLDTAPVDDPRLWLDVTTLNAAAN